MGFWTGTVPTFVVGKLRATDMATMAAISTALTDTASVWVPTLTNLTLGNGTQTAEYRQVGKWVDWYWQFILGTTSAVGTVPQFTLPVAPAAFYSTGGGRAFPGMVHIRDEGVAEKQGVIKINAGSTLQVEFWNGTPTNAQITAAAPFAWGATDAMTAWGTYVAA